MRTVRRLPRRSRAVWRARGGGRRIVRARARRRGRGRAGWRRSPRSRRSKRTRGGRRGPGSPSRSRSSPNCPRISRRPTSPDCARRSRRPKSTPRRTTRCRKPRPSRSVAEWTAEPVIEPVQSLRRDGNDRAGARRNAAAEVEESEAPRGAHPVGRWLSRMLGFAGRRRRRAARAGRRGFRSDAALDVRLDPFPFGRRRGSRWSLRADDLSHDVVELSVAHLPLADPLAFAGFERDEPQDHWRIASLESYEPCTPPAGRERRVYVIEYRGRTAASSRRWRCLRRRLSKRRPRSKPFTRRSRRTGLCHRAGAALPGLLRPPIGSRLTGSGVPFVLRVRAGT